MKRFYEEVQVAPKAGGWQVLLDARPIRTRGGTQQIVPTEAAAELLAGEWRGQGEEIDPRGFVFRDLADLAIDAIEPDRRGPVATLAAFAGTDTLCYRADPDEPLYRRQLDLWEPLVTACEARHRITFERVSGIMHRPQPEQTLGRLRAWLAAQDGFTLAGLQTLASLTSSLITALAALEPDADIPALFTAANAEQDWQADLWGWDTLAEEDRQLRLEAFTRAAEFLRAVRG